MLKHIKYILFSLLLFTVISCNVNSFELPEEFKANLYILDWNFEGTKVTCKVIDSEYPTPDTIKLDVLEYASTVGALDIEWPRNVFGAVIQKETDYYILKAKQPLPWANISHNE